MKTKKFNDLMKEFYTEDEMNEAVAKAKLRAKLMRSISENVRQKMEEKNIGFNDLVKIIGTSPAQINRVLNGNTNLTIDSLVKICTALDLEPEIIFKKVS